MASLDITAHRVSATTGLAHGNKLAFLFDHLLGAGEQDGRHIEANGFGCRDVDHKLELGRLFDGEVGGFAPFRILST
jgi:hypothetical protein